MIRPDASAAAVSLFSKDRADAYHDREGRLCVATTNRIRPKVVALLGEPDGEMIPPATSEYGKRRAPRILIYVPEETE